MLLAGQNKYWGTTEEATQFWLEFGLNHVMIKREKDIRLIDKNGNLVISDFKRLFKLQKKYKVKYHIHLYNLIINNIFITPSLKKGQPILNKILADLDSMIKQYNLYPLITIHPPRFGHPQYNFDLDEKSALKNSLDFFKNLRLHSNLALETMHDPYRNPGHALLGYKAVHFLKLIGNRNFGLCIDTGHLKMAKEDLREFLKLPYPLNSIHLNGNDGTSDQHHLPTKENVGNFKSVVEALKKCNGPIVLEVANHNLHYSKDEIRKCIDFWKKTVKNY